VHLNYSDILPLTCFLFAPTRFAAHDLILFMISFAVPLMWDLLSADQVVAIDMLGKLLRLGMVRSGTISAFNYMQLFSKDVVAMLVRAFDAPSAATVNFHHFTHLAHFAELYGPPALIANWHFELVIGFYKKIHTNFHDSVVTWSLMVRDEINFQTFRIDSKIFSSLRRGEIMLSDVSCLISSFHPGIERVCRRRVTV
jgi:hypothetical protein